MMVFCHPQTTRFLITLVVRSVIILTILFRTVDFIDFFYSLYILPGAKIPEPANFCRVTLSNRILIAIKAHQAAGSAPANQAFVAQQIASGFPPLVFINPPLAVPVIRVTQNVTHLLSAHALPDPVLYPQTPELR